MRLLFILIVCITSLQAQKLEVGINKPYKTIKQALKAANDGDTVLVYKGIYKEGNLRIDKKIVFLGKDFPVLDGQKKVEVLSIHADSVVVKGFKVINSGFAALEDPCGIKVYNKSFVLIEGNQLDDNFFGIYIQNGRNCVVKNNIIIAYGKEEQQIGNGIHAWKSNDLQIIGNTIKGHRDGIYFEFVYDSVIWRNIATNNIRYGLHFMFSSNDSYLTNIFRNNGAGVAVMFSKNVTMINNYFDENWGASSYGLLLKEISDSYIHSNHFKNNTSGIYMEGTNRIKIEKNVFQSNGWAMKIQASCMDNEIVNNNFQGNTFDMGTNGSLVLNTFNNNYWDKYEGYDINKDGLGDIPYHPLSLFAVLVEKNPSAMLLFRSFMITLLDKSEKVLPSITPDNFVDKAPLMKPLKL
ncbi:MAG TPA: nitrous oxide reductase family maturation protein NosD [Flavobacterium sp.]|uniref:nitrous oxide reductase family maturation protein NosD n=1 Tax=unclassified Flavobacterium TaxID=196869 RepID=UPI000E7F015E|nr:MULTISPECIES: nitrous oxide reductase family maturation protein NosD [unclassified Flavobacterium]HBI02239.1 nitrous oxide reductase family maturation protein NosD [Flavobacterium sp.]HRE78797.1 nitrous oxide reductase family maturation protein NosD [Flavobacterium sp.]